MNTTKTYNQDRIYYLNHDVRRPLSNIVGISGLMVSKDLDEKDKKQIRVGLKKTLKEFHQIMAQFDIVMSESTNAIVAQSA